MTATVTYHPRLAQGCDHINEMARQENIRQEQREKALDILRNHEWYSREAKEDAWVILSLVGTDHEKRVAQEQIALLTAEPETPADVLATMRDRVPEILIGAAIGAAVILAWAGWL